jgi:hypothetical protein
VRKYANEHNIPYNTALSDKKCSDSYKTPTPIIQKPEKKKATRATPTTTKKMICTCAKKGNKMTCQCTILKK